VYTADAGEGKVQQQFMREGSRNVYCNM